MAELDKRDWRGPVGLALMAAWGTEFVACGLVIAGVTGSAGVGAMDARYRAQRSCVAALPSPYFSSNPYLSLPWMHAEGPHFIPAYQYGMERAKGRAFERGGIGGLIAEGYFASIVLSAGSEPVVDGAVLDGYERQRQSCSGLDIYLRP